MFELPQKTIDKIWLGNYTNHIGFPCAHGYTRSLVLFKLATRRYPVSSSSINEGGTSAANPGGAAEKSNNGFVRSVGLFSATAINMTQMCGIGPFITIPLMVAVMGGPQAIVGWIAGAILAVADGVVWAELGAAMPGSGGTYVYLREAFQYRTGKLMPFLFIWTAFLAIPLILSSGVIGLVQYLEYYFPTLTPGEERAISLLVVGSSVVALYRRVGAVGKLTTALWAVMFLAVAVVTAAALGRFDPRLAFSYPAGAFALDRRFFAGLGAGLVIAVYDYLGYSTAAYMGEELRDPGRVLPRAIVISVLGMMAIYLSM